MNFSSVSVKQQESQDGMIRGRRIAPWKENMSQFQAPPPPVIRRQKDAKGRLFIDYKQVDELRRAMTQNGKLLSRKRLEMSAGDQSMLGQAVKRARFMALLPFTNAAN